MKIFFACCLLLLASLLTPAAPAYARFFHHPTLAPTLTGFSPTVGIPASPGGTSGTLVTFTGTGLTGVTSVSFGGVLASVFTTGTGTSLTAYVPLGAVTGPVTVTTPGGIASSAAAFTVYGPPGILSFAPTTGSAGTVVVVMGINLTAATNVLFNSVPT